MVRRMEQKDLEKISEAVMKLLEDIMATSAMDEALSINLRLDSPGIALDEFRDLVLKKGYDPACVCVPGSRDHVRPMAVKIQYVKNIEVVSAIYSRDMLLEDYMALRKASREMR